MPIVGHDEGFVGPKGSGLVDTDGLQVGIVDSIPVGERDWRLF